MNLQLAADDDAFRDEVRQFLREHLTPELKRRAMLTTSIYPDPDVSGAWQAALARRGWLVPLWPREWGGTGWNGVRRFIFETECALAGAPLVHPMGVRLVGPVILAFGTEEQKSRYLPRILAGEDYWCQGFSEPGAGSDLASLALRAESASDGDDYVLNGSKIWTTHAQYANRMFALVRTGTTGKRQDGISFLLVDLKSRGVSIRPIRTMGGDPDLNQVFFDDVRVPKADRIGAENGGWDCAKYLLEFERGAGIASPRLRGLLVRIGDALAGVRSSGRTDAEALLTRFGEVIADLDTFEMLELEILGPLVPGQSPGPRASMLKLLGSRLRQSITELGVAVLGYAALRWRAPDELAVHDLLETLMPEYLNGRAVTIFGGAAEVQLGIIAKTMVGV